MLNRSRYAAFKGHFVVARHNSLPHLQMWLEAEAIDYDEIFDWHECESITESSG